MTELETNINDIMVEKEQKIIPENIKKGVNILGVTGTLEAGGGIKQFATIEEMNASTGNKEGDLAVVYNLDASNLTVEKEFTKAILPNTVVLPERLTSSAVISFQSADPFQYMDGRGSLSNTHMSCDFNTGNPETDYKIYYKSTDGITYTKQKEVPAEIIFDYPIKYGSPWEGTQEWNDAIGYFFQVGDYNFNGLYKYKLKNKKTDDIRFISTETAEINYNTNTFTLNSFLPGVYSEKKLSQYPFSGCYTLYIDTTDSLKLLYCPTEATTVFDCLYINTNNEVIGLETMVIKDSSPVEIEQYTIDPITYELSNKQIISTNPIIESDGSINSAYVLINTKSIPVTVDEGILYSGSTSYKLKMENEPNYLWSSNTMDIRIFKDTYAYAPTQLNAKAKNVWGDTFYGANGVEIGTLNNTVDVDATEIRYKISIVDDMQTKPIICNTDMSNMCRDYKGITIPVKLDTSKVINMSEMFEGCTNLTSIPELDTSNVTNMDYMISTCSNITTIPKFNTSKVTSMNSMFSNCTNLTEIPVIDTSNVTGMMNMFRSCTNLASIPLLNTSKVTNMSEMFRDCTNLASILGLNTFSVTNMQYMFSNCSNLTSIPELNTSKVTDMSSMFGGCSNLTSIPQLDTQNVTNMDGMFSSCTNLTSVPLLNTINVTNMYSMFYKCTSLTTVAGLDLSKVEDITSIFSDCTNLTNVSLTGGTNLIGMSNAFLHCENLSSIPVINTSKVTNMRNSFWGCKKITEVPALNTSSTTNMYATFYDCTNLVTIPLLNTSNVTDMSFLVGKCPALSDESLNNILQMCANAKAYTNTKTLKALGLAQTQINKCKTLSNWSVFTAAGWTA